MITLQQNETYRLTLEKSNGFNWWLELIERATGVSQVLCFTHKAKAIAAFENMALDEVAKWFERANITKQKIYKAGVI